VEQNILFDTVGNFKHASRNSTVFIPLVQNRCTKILSSERKENPEIKVHFRKSFLLFQIPPLSEDLDLNLHCCENLKPCIWNWLSSQSLLPGRKKQNWNQNIINS